MTAFIEEHRDVFGVGPCRAIGPSDNGEPICRVLPAAASTYYEHLAVERDPDLASARAKQDVLNKDAIKRVFDASGGRYGARKVWHALRREGRNVARCTVERLMKAMGLQGVVRGKKTVTTSPDKSQPCPDDRVNRAFVAQRPNQLWGRPLKAPLVQAQWTTTLPMSQAGRARSTLLS